MSRLRNRRLRVAGTLTAITMTALLAACSTGSGDDDAASDSGGSVADGSAEAPGGTSRELGAEAADRATGSSGASQAKDSGPATPEMERAVVSTGAVSLTSDDVPTARQAVQRVVDAQGGTIAEENTESDPGGDTSYVRLVVRVPSGAFGAAMEALEKAGTLQSSTRGSEDVTTEVIDTGVRVRAQEASLKRVELLLSRAESLKDIIWIESQLTSRQAELDSLKSQQSWLEDQTSLSTITVDISESSVVDPPKKEDDQDAGFLTGLDGGMKALGAMFVAVTTILGALLPFAVVALVLGVPAWLVVRRRRGAAQAAAPAPTDA